LCLYIYWSGSSSRQFLRFLSNIFKKQLRNLCFIPLLFCMKNTSFKKLFTEYKRIYKDHTWNTKSQTYIQQKLLLPSRFRYSREATHRFRTSSNAKSNPEIKGRNSIIFRHDALQVSDHALFTSTPHEFSANHRKLKNKRWL
jgi:hypothetical protein